MALDAIHIRARSGSPLRHDEDHFANVDWRGPQANSPLSSTPPLRPSLRPGTHRPGIGSSSATSVSANDDHEWRNLRTGESQTIRMPPRFVRATQLSDPSLQPVVNVATETEANVAPTVNPEYHPHQHASTSLDSDAVSASAPTLGQLYSQLAQDMPTTSHAQGSSSGLPSTLTLSQTHKQRRSAEQPYNHDHHHRHHSVERQRSEWFISRAMTKWRRSNELPATFAAKSAQRSTRRSADQVNEAQSNEVQSSDAGASRCQRCGDLLPSNPTQEEMARHRQSIGHRLGLNAPVSSASASEAQTPDVSEAPTPTHHSGSASPASVSLLDASMQALHRRSEKLPRRLSNAPRWKKISRDNVGHNLLSRMGWKEGMGLGVQEWKWQQLRREKVKRQRSNAVRALLQRENATAPESRSAEVAEPEWMQLLAQQDNPAASAESSSLATYFPFQYDSQNLRTQREAAQAWLSSLPPADLEWFQCLTADERQALELALLAGQITRQDIQDALHGSMTDNMSGTGPASVPVASMEALVGEQSNALLYPVEAELRADRSGIGSRQPSHSGNVRQGRRSRAAEGSVEIRRQSSPSLDDGDGGHKKVRSNSTERAPRPLGRARSHSTSSSGRPQAKHADLTRRKREAAYRKEKQEWLDLRASLS